MSLELSFETVTPETLAARVRVLHEQNYRLAQISATRLAEHTELTYSFDLEGALTNLRLLLPVTGAALPSISSIYWCAFLYENEIHDLFNVNVEGLAVDFHGMLYKTAVKFPFGSTKAPSTKPAVQPSITVTKRTTPPANGQPVVTQS